MASTYQKLLKSATRWGLVSKSAYAALPQSSLLSLTFNPPLNVVSLHSKSSSRSFSHSSIGSSDNVNPGYDSDVDNLSQALSQWPVQSEQIETYFTEGSPMSVMDKESFATLLREKKRHQGIMDEYFKGELSTEDAATRVGFALPQEGVYDEKTVLTHTATDPAKK